MTRARDLSRLVQSSEDSPTSELLLTAVDPDNPAANVFIRFRGEDGATIGVMGFTAAGDSTMSMTSYRDHRLKFRTGNADQDAFLDRVFMYGNASSSWLGIQSPGDTGGTFIRYTTVDYSETKGIIGFASTTDDDIDFINYESGGNFEFATTGGGVVKFNPKVQFANGTVSAPSLTFIGENTTGLYRPANNMLGVAINGVEPLRVTATGISLLDGVTEPSTVTGRASIFIDSADGDLKIKYADGTLKVIVGDT